MKISPTYHFFNNSWTLTPAFLNTGHSAVFVSRYLDKQDFLYKIYFPITFSFFFFIQWILVLFRSESPNIFYTFGDKAVFEEVIVGVFIYIYMHIYFCFVKLSFVAVFLRMKFTRVKTYYEHQFVGVGSPHSLIARGVDHLVSLSGERVERTDPEFLFSWVYIEVGYWWKRDECV